MNAIRTLATARFWVYHNGGFVKLGLRDGQRLEVCTGGSTDEGHSFTATVWERDGDTVTESGTSWGRDCDGRHEDGYEVTCAVGNLRAEYVELDKDGQRCDCTDGNPVTCIFLPTWEREGQHQRDYTAEEAGY